MKIKNKIFLSFFIPGLILTILGVSIVYQYSSNILKKEINNHLKTVTEARAEYLNTFLNQNKQLVQLIAESIILKNFIKASPQDANYQFTKEQAEIKLKETISTVHEIIRICILNNEGISILSSNPECIGTSKATTDIFQEGKKGTYIKDIHFDEAGVGEEIVLSISSPIKKGDILLGVVTIKINPEDLYKVTSSPIGLGNTGEIYLVNKDFLMISPSRFLDNTILKQKVDTVNARNCFSLKDISHPTEHIGHEAVKTYSDYRNVSVLGSHIHIAEMNWCLIAETNVNEALSPITNLLFIIILITIAIIIFVLIIANLIGNNIATPIKKLQKGAEIVSTGNLNHKVGNGDEDEIGQLARAFDKMTGAIKKSRAEVDKKVTAQTKEIRENQKTLEDQQKALLNILEDVEKEKDKVSAEKDRTTTILQGIGDGVFVIDKNMIVTLFNSIAERISGFQAKDIIGKKFNNILKFTYEKTDKISDQFIKDCLSFGTIQNMHNHNLLEKKDGTKIPISDSAAPLKDKNENTNSCVVVFRDATREREIDRAKSEFVSLASHQLRTPLTAISWYSEMLLDDTSKITAQQKKYLDEIYNGNKKMVDLVGALLNVSRIEMGTLAIEPIPTNLTEIAKEVLKELEQQIITKKLKIEKIYDKKLDKINVDPKLINIIFLNLLSNAVKYTPDKGNIKLSIAKQKSDILITISDTGYGIPKHQHDKIFTKLFRADNIIEKDTTGTGLGLYIVKAIVDESKGKIWFESKINKGTTFYITIPLSGMKKKEGTKGLERIA